MDARTDEKKAVSAGPYIKKQIFHKSAASKLEPQLSNKKIDENPESDEDDEEKRTLFVVNLDERVTEELLYELFLQAGPIEAVHIPKGENGRQRNFGFITYIHLCTVEYAVRLLQGTRLFRKYLNIKVQRSSRSSDPQRAVEPNRDSAQAHHSNSQPLRCDIQQTATNSKVHNPFNQQHNECTKDFRDKRNDDHYRHDPQKAQHGVGDECYQKQQPGHQIYFGADRQ